MSRRTSIRTATGCSTASTRTTSVADRGGREIRGRTCADEGGGIGHRANHARAGGQGGGEGSQWNARGNRDPEGLLAEGIIESSQESGYGSGLHGQNDDVGIRDDLVIVVGRRRAGRVGKLVACAEERI